MFLDFDPILCSLSLRTLDTHFATLAAGNTVMIAARLIAADFAGYKALSGRRTVGISCRVMLLCKQTRIKKINNALFFLFS